jgi:hypothetical protein
MVFGNIGFGAESVEFEMSESCSVKTPVDGAALALTEIAFILPWFT